MTSGAFFATNSNTFDMGKIDVAFIDGAHTYSQALQDVGNCLKHLRKGGVIVLHDCNPPSEAPAIPAPSLKAARKLVPGWTGGWCGDVWKAIAHLRSVRDDLLVFVLDADWGVGVVTQGQPETMLHYRPEDIQSLLYRDLDADRERILNLKKPEYFHAFLRTLRAMP